MIELNPQKHDDIIEFLSEVLCLFKMTIHLPGKSPSWKPVQTGAVISTTAAFSLQNLYLMQNNFKPLFRSRLTQDALKNIFSGIRQKNATPRPLQFKTALRKIISHSSSSPVGRRTIKCTTQNTSQILF